MENTNNKIEASKNTTENVEKGTRIEDIRKKTDSSYGDHMEKKVFSQIFTSSSGKTYLKIGERMYNKKKGCVTYCESANIMLITNNEGEIIGARVYSDRPAISDFAKSIAIADFGIPKEMF